VTLISAVALCDGSEVELRLLEADDRERLVRLFYRLSPESVYRRFLSPRRDPSGLERLLDVDHCNREAVAAVFGDEVVGVARYFWGTELATADLAVLVEDAWQGRGLGVILLERLSEIARSRGVEAFTATILAENRPAIRLVRRVFPAAVFHLDGPEMSVQMPFGSAPETGLG
jgi:GNAT superfamily N-acetyltransferase